MTLNWAIFESISVGASAIVGVLTLAGYLHQQRSEIRKKKILSWQQTIIHSLFQKSSKTWHSFDDIKRDYRSEATAKNKDFGHIDLDEESLRNILISMMSSRIIDQKGGDMYCLSTISEDSMNSSMQNLINPLIGHFLESVQSPSSPPNIIGSIIKSRFDDEKIANSTLISTIAEQNEKLTISDVVLRTSKQTGLDQTYIHAEVLKLVSTGVVSLESDRLSIPNLGA